jgi:hypothetical protein
LALGGLKPADCFFGMVSKPVLRTRAAVISFVPLTGVLRERFPKDENARIFNECECLNRL